MKTSSSLRTKLENVFETMFFGATTVFVMGWVIAMCVQPHLVTL